jgi:hypothetical protein
MKWTSRLSRSNFATMIGVPLPQRLAAFSAAASCGRRSSASAPLPVSTSLKVCKRSKPSAYGEAGESCLLSLEAETGAVLTLSRHAGVRDGGAHDFSPFLNTSTSQSTARTACIDTMCPIPAL